MTAKEKQPYKMLNSKKVKTYIENSLKEYEKNYSNYPQIFKDVNIDIYSGSFGRCFITLKNKYYSIYDKYVNCYKDIDAVISQFVIESTNNINYKYYYNDHEKKLSYKLKIFKNNILINEIESENPSDVKNEFIKIIIAKDKRGIKTTIKYVPYSTKINIFQYFNDFGEFKYKYVYEFEGLNY